MRIINEFESRGNGEDFSIFRVRFNADFRDKEDDLLVAKDDVWLIICENEQEMRNAMARELPSFFSPLGPAVSFRYKEIGTGVS